MRQAQRKKEKDRVAIALMLAFCVIALTSIFTIKSGVQHLLHLKSKSKILQPIEIMGFFMNFFVKFKEIFCCNCCIFISDVI